MAGRRSAVIIGVDESALDAGLPSLRNAEKDARSVRDVLCDPEIGTFDPADVALHLGPDATVDAVKASLSRAVRESDVDDVLLVYFAGHTMAPEWSHDTDVYLVTSDLDDRALSQNPDAGLRMAYLKRDVLGRCRGTALLILDCCRAGSLLATPGQRIDLISHEGRPEARYSALMASTHDRPGALSRHVLAGLRGQAMDRRGQVTFQAMSNYVLEQDLSPAPGVVTKSWGGTTVLTRPGDDVSETDRPALTSMPDGVILERLENPLDRYADDILALIDRISRFAAEPQASSVSPDGGERVEYLRAAMGADSVALLEYTATGVVTIDGTSRFDRERLQHFLRPPEDEFIPSNPVWFGHTVQYDGLTLFCAPITRALFLVVVDPRPELAAIGQPLAKVLETVWRSDFAAHPLEAETLVLTALRQTCGRLPTALYQRCFQLYQEILRTLSIVFQPIVTIGPTWHQVGVHSYEALARRSLADQSAPGAMLQVAHTWGDRFVIERDKIITEKALLAYARAHTDGPWDVPKPVSVNVSVRSLLSDSYIATLRAAIAAANLEPSAVTLEISEGDPIEPRSDEQWPDEPHAHFHNRLAAIARDVGVAFAVDDFGSGYASTSRMAELPLTQIKVDRAVLHHRTALQELDFIVSVARDAHDRGETHAPRVVIVEGVDAESPVTLRQIHENKIRHVQGYITGQPAAATLRQMALETRKEIADRVSGDDDSRAIELARGGPAGGRASLRKGA